MRTTQVIQAAQVVNGLRELAQEIGYDVAIQPGPSDAVAMVVWEIATVSINSRSPVQHQAEELVYIMALLVERLERGGRDLELTVCQEAQIVDVVASAICAELGLASDRRTSLAIADVWANVDPAMACEVEDLVARVASCIGTYVIAAA